MPVIRLHVHVHVQAMREGENATTRRHAPHRSSRRAQTLGPARAGRLLHQESSNNARRAFWTPPGELAQTP